jgi:hypothetical protein
MSEELSGRVDLDKYGSGCRTMENFYPLIQGPARKRSGFGYRNRVKNSLTQYTLLHRFVFDRANSYILEFGGQYLRFHTDSGTVVETGLTITGITNANPAVVTVAAHGYTTGQWVFISGVNGMTQINGRYYIVGATTANTFALQDIHRGLDINSTSYGAYTSAGTSKRVYQISTPYLATQLHLEDKSPALDFVQSGDVIYITYKQGNTHAPYKLTRTSDTNWSLAEFLPTSGPFQDTDPDNTITVYSSARTGSVTLTASASVWVVSDIGRSFLLEQKAVEDIKPWETNKAVLVNDIVRSDGKNYRAVNAATTGTVKPIHPEGSKYDGVAGVQWEYRDAGFGIATITAFASSTSVTATVVKPIPDGAVGVANASTRWAESEWWGGDMPTHVTFFRERLCFARAKDQKLWFSVAADFENFADRDENGAATIDMAARIELSSDKNNKIKWLAPSDRLIVGTESVEFVVGEITTQDVFGAGNIKASPQTFYGAKDIAPARIGNTIFFVQGSGRKVRELAYSIDSDGLASIDITRLSPRVVPQATTIIKLAYQQEPHSIVWAVRSDGVLLGFTYNREENVFGWHRIATDGFVEDVEVIPAAAGSDAVWILVKRLLSTGPSQNQFYLEKLEIEWDSTLDQDDAFFVDSGLVYSGAPADVISNLYHLEGREVTILADGAVHPTRTISGGSITLNDDYSKVSVGLPYVATLKTNRIEAGGTIGTAQGRIKRISKVIIRLLDTLGIKVGPSVDKLETINFRKGSDPMDAPPPIFTGDKEVNWRGGYETDGSIMIISDQPLPATVVAIMPEMETSG